MKKLYQVNSIIKFAIEDIFAEGEVEKHGMDEIKCFHQHESLTTLIKNIRDAYCFEETDMNEPGELDEKNRIEFSRMEDGDSYIATPSDIEAWKLGKCRLWRCNYSMDVSIVVEDSVDVAKILEEEKRSK